MNEIQSTARNHKVRTFLRDVWSDHLDAQRKLLQWKPYDEYLMNRRDR